MTSRPAYLRGRQEVPEPPSIAARRRNSTATTVQLAPVSLDPKSRQYAHYIPQTPSPKVTFGSAKSTDYFRTAGHGGTPSSSTGTTSPYALSNLNSTNQQQARRLSSAYGQPPTPSVHQHVPAWHVRDEVAVSRERGSSFSDHGGSENNAEDDPLNILDTLPIQNLRLGPSSANAPMSDSRCGTLKRPTMMSPVEERRTNTWPAENNIALNASGGIASRRLATAATAGMVGHESQSHLHHHNTSSSRPVQRLRTVEPDTTVRRPPELSKLPHSTPHLNHATPADCYI